MDIGDPQTISLSRQYIRASDRYCGCVNGRAADRESWHQIGNAGGQTENLITLTGGEC